jgi:hypothetical protein
MEIQRILSTLIYVQNSEGTKKSKRRREVIRTSALYTKRPEFTPENRLLRLTSLDVFFVPSGNCWDSTANPAIIIR